MKLRGYKFFRWLLPLWVLVALLVVDAAAARSRRVHVVARGHTLGKIARRYHVTIEEICRANHISRHTPLKPGQKLIIPGDEDSRDDDGAPRANAERQKPKQWDGPMTAHLVARGHSLAKIARRYRTTVRLLRRYNDIRPGERLHPGQCLLVPLTRRSPKRFERRKWPCKPHGVVEHGNGGRVSLDPYARRPRHPGVVTLVRGSTKWTGRLLTRRGKRVRRSALAVLRKMMFDRRTGKTHPVDPRLAKVLTKISDHFGGRPIHIISGYRGPHSNPYTPRSKHRLGRAIDFTIPGVPKEAIRDYCHTLRHVGVGYYPRSSFIHVDVRDVTTHWTDISGPGERPIYTSVTGGEPEHDQQRAPEGTRRRRLRDSRGGRKNSPRLRPPRSHGKKNTRDNSQRPSKKSTTTGSTHHVAKDQSQPAGNPRHAPSHR